jgi:2-aminobenzoate-CoA ligase
VLVEDLHLVPGNRVLLRGPNSPMMAACWFAVMKAGGVAVATMPLLRAKELNDVITKAQITHALCDARLAAELDAACAACPTLPPSCISKQRRPKARRRVPGPSPRTLRMS